MTSQGPKFSAKEFQESLVEEFAYLTTLALARSSDENSITIRIQIEPGVIVTRTTGGARVDLIKDGQRVVIYKDDGTRFGLYGPIKLIMETINRLRRALILEALARVLS